MPRHALFTTVLLAGCGVQPGNPTAADTPPASRICPTAGGLVHPCWVDEDLAVADAVIEGSLDYDLYGFVHPDAGDVDGDGIADLLIGAAGMAGLYLHRGPVLAGWADRGASAAAWIGPAGSWQDDFSTVATTADMNGDGLPEVIVGGTEGSDILLWPGSAAGGTRTPADVFTTIAGWGGTKLQALSVGDADGDGAPDLLVGGSDRNRAWLFLGPFAGDLTIAEADVVYTGEDETGTTARFLGDVDGDGVDDFAVGATGALADRGRVYVVTSTPVSGTVVDLATEADHVLTGDAGDRAGWVWDVGDRDGDGLADLAIGAPKAFGDRGGVYLVHDLPSLAGAADAADVASLTLVGESSLSAVGESPVRGNGDVTGDGVGDLFVGAFNEDGGYGVSYVVAGRPRGTLDLSRALVKLRGESWLSLAGWYGGFLADQDGDGRDEVVVGAPVHDLAAFSRGRVYVSLGGF